MRGVRLVLLIVVAVGGACSEASDVEAPIELPATPPSSDAAPPPPEPEAGPVPDPCDPTALAARRSLAGCHFVTTMAVGTSPLLTGRVWGGCQALVVSNPSSGRARLRLRFRDRDDVVREEDAAPYARRAVVDGRHVRYEPLEDGALGPRESAVVAAVVVPDVDADFPSPSRCPTRGFVEDAQPFARDGKVTVGIELRSDQPVVAVQVAMYAQDAMNEGNGPTQVPSPLVPVHLWEPAATETGVFRPGLPAQFTLEDELGETYEVTMPPAHTFALAAFDETHVSLPHAQGMLSEGTLQRGEVFSHVTSDALTGRRAVADKPVALVTYAPQAVIPWDFSHELGIDSYPVFTMGLPSAVWGAEYVAVRHGDRWRDLAEEPAWRILGGADGTELVYEPYHPIGAPDRIASGELAVFFADEPFVVRSQDEEHAFYLSESMTGSRYQRVRAGHRGPRDEHRGGSVTVHQLATKRYARRYTFFALPRFPEQSLVLVRPRNGGDVRLDCAGVLSGWRPVGNRFELLRVQLTGHLFEPITYADSEPCQAGAHWIEGDGPFWGTLWGWGNSDTFAAIGIRTEGAYALPLFASDPE